MSKASHSQIPRTESVSTSPGRVSLDPSAGGWFPASFTRLVTRFLLWAAAVVFLLSASGAYAQELERFSPAQTKPDRIVNLAIAPWGLHPNKLDLRPGRVALFIQNRSLFRDLTVNMTRDGKSGAALTSQHSAKASDVWHFVTLPPGTYHLTVVGLPSAWQCTLNVAAK